MFIIHVFVYIAVTIPSLQKADDEDNKKKKKSYVNRV
jgi:hypothetical protein